MGQRFSLKTKYTTLVQYYIKGRRRNSGQKSRFLGLRSAEPELFVRYIRRSSLNKDMGTPDIDLPNAEVGKPSGYFHIGHSKAALLNKYFAEKYRGKLIIRFDDTNSAKESNVFVHSLLKDIDTLGIVYDAVTFTSDYFPQLLKMAEKLIDPMLMILRIERSYGTEPRCRSNTKEKNLELWNEMIRGSDQGKKCCLSGKLDFGNANKCLRNPYKVYPTYGFASPFVDALEGVTHALLSDEYRDRDAQYHWIPEDMGVRRVELFEFSKLNMTVLSKCKLSVFVQNGTVDGWDDPRLPTLQGMLRRGLKIEALHQFVLEQELRTAMSWCIMPRHKKFIPAGEKCRTYAKNIWIEYVDAKALMISEELTLMDWGNVIFKEIQRDEDGNVIKIIAVLHLEGSVKTTRMKLTWLPDTDELVKLRLVEFDYLITKKEAGM
ncbi:LOW QUALITY PROTEIN: hypothetical protein Cgig2_005682 [Carnegiea gigantea]|uniref:Glutamyl/glutaminyl-tRNA synthetase class Ib catalytic domain-containing protein n=1 Tax=Carnegiea gigantea TaxID=171969 RepID=A0A9Q1QIV1_9CARY|nr:LOW QUALITY PROTEIN: hypothetical protein Cgig2_005682 [Carnegiea gigantea]